MLMPFTSLIPVILYKNIKNQTSVNNFKTVLTLATRRGADTLPKCPGSHPILHLGLKLNPSISAVKYQKY